MFKIKGKDVFGKSMGDFKELFNKFHTLWLKYFKYILVLLLIVDLCIVGYVWYKYLHDRDVTENEKQEYTMKKKAEITFKKKKFDELKQKALSRKEEFEKEHVLRQDIFYRSDDETVIHTYKQIINSKTSPTGTNSASSNILIHP